jgi:periplasmic protein TonB
MHTFYSYLLFICTILFSTHAQSQTPDTTWKRGGTGIADTSDTFFMTLDQVATFPGGEEAWFRFLSENMPYPSGAREKGVEGTVHVRFVIERDGTVTRVEVEASTARELDQAALDAVRGSPDWIPAMHNGQAVRSIMVLPITFRLERTSN